VLTSWHTSSAKGAAISNAYADLAETTVATAVLPRDGPPKMGMHAGGLPNVLQLIVIAMWALISLELLE
jgi:hypothetical protein